MTDTYLPTKHQSVFNFKSTETTKLMVLDALLQAAAACAVTITEYSTSTFNKVETVSFAVKGNVGAIKALKTQIDLLKQKLVDHRPSEY